MLKKEETSSSYEATLEQKKNLVIKSEENRKMGVSLADEICRKYRREGKYFDELIK